MARRVVHGVDELRDGEAERGAHRAGGGAARLEIAMLHEQHAVFEVAVDLPLVRGVCFGDVDDEDARRGAVVVEDLL